VCGSHLRLRAVGNRLIPTHTMSVEFFMQNGVYVVSKNLCISHYPLLLKTSIPWKNGSIASATPSVNPGDICEYCSNPGR
jgi:hypothetical protein